MALNDAGKNALLDSGKAGIAYLALHSGAVALTERSGSVALTEQ